MTMPILDIQKRARELGRIRIGQVVPTGNGKTRPEKLDRFRLTSSAKHLLEKVAELYGGEVREWTPQGGGPTGWEVITTSTRLPIMVPPQPVTQWYEFWTRGGCAHRCDGRTNWQTGEPCDLESNEHLEALKKPTTRLNVVLRDIEGIGVWRLETHGWNAAVELPDAAEFLAQAGGYVNGWVALEERVSVSDGKTRRFMVPTIEIDVTPAELMAGKGRVATPTLEGPVAPKALEAGPADASQTAVDPGEVSLPTLDDIQAATNTQVLGSMWRFLGAHNARTPELEAALNARAAELNDVARQQNADPDEPIEGELVGDDGGPDADAAWAEVLKAAGSLQPPMTTSEVQDDYRERYGHSAGEASAAELGVYLQVLRVKAGVAA